MKIREGFDYRGDFGIVGEKEIEIKGLGKNNCSRQRCRTH